MVREIYRISFSVSFNYVVTSKAREFMLLLTVQINELTTMMRRSEDQEDLQDDRA